MKFVLSICLLNICIINYAQENVNNDSLKVIKLLSEIAFASNTSETKLNLNQTKQPDVWVNKVIPIFMLTMGAGIAGIWTTNIVGDKLNVKGNFFQWRDESGQLYYFHVISEYLISGALITSGIGLMKNKNWAITASFVSLGALFNTSLNSLGWSFAKKERYTNSIPMLIGLSGSIISVKILFTYKYTK